MKRLTASDPETRSVDVVAENVEKLKGLFPEIVTEGPDGPAVNVDVLKQLVGDGTVTDAEEKYGLNWHGKRRARQLALTPSTGTLRPCPEDSVDWDTTQNLVIEGDNLEVLKLLQKSYAGKVKLIYIDPPYNTGKDFVYPDNFQDNIRNYLELTGQVDGGAKISSNTEASGRFHTDWLNMMYPRLKASRTLLRDDGIILISVDEREYSHLRTTCSEVFGEENAIGTLVWKGATDNNPTQIATEHEYLLCFGRSKESVAAVWKNASDIAKLSLLAEYQRLRANPSLNELQIQSEIRKFIKAHRETLSAITHYDRVDSKGLYTGSRKVHNPKPGGYRYDVIHPTTGKACVPPINGYRYPEDRMAELVAGDRILFGDDEGQIIQVKEYLADYKGKLSSVIQLDSRAGANELNSLFDVQKLFSNPKPVVLLREFFDFMLVGDDLVLDFFAGSGTTGHAVMAQNAIDGGTRRYILVQLPEPLDPTNKDQKAAAEFCDKLGKPRNIAELTKERLRRAGAKIREELEAKRKEPEGKALELSLLPSDDETIPSSDSSLLTPDTGFRVFKLDSTNIREWEPDRDNFDQTLLDSIDHLKDDRTEADILYELLLKLGLDLCVATEEKEVRRKEKEDGRKEAEGKGHTIHAIGGGVLMACLSEHIGREDVEPIGHAMVQWHKELAPAGETTCVFRDSAFADDVAKTNMAAILEQNGITTVRSL